MQDHWRIWLQWMENFPRVLLLRIFRSIQESMWISVSIGFRMMICQLMTDHHRWKHSCSLQFTVLSQSRQMNQIWIREPPPDKIILYRPILWKRIPRKRTVLSIWKIQLAVISQLRQRMKKTAMLEWILMKLWLPCRMQPLWREILLAQQVALPMDLRQLLASTLLKLLTKWQRGIEFRMKLLPVSRRRILSLPGRR